MNGRRGRYLIFKGMVYVLLGIIYAIPTPTSVRSLPLNFMDMIGLPEWVVGLPWFIAAAVGIAGAFRRPPDSDSWAFAILAIAAASWAAISLLGWIFGTSPYGYFLALMFAALAGATVTVAGMMDSTDVNSEIQGRAGQVERGEL